MTKPRRPTGDHRATLWVQTATARMTALLKCSQLWNIADIWNCSRMKCVCFNKDLYTISYQHYMCHSAWVTQPVYLLPLSGQPCLKTSTPCPLYGIQVITMSMCLWPYHALVSPRSHSKQGVVKLVFNFNHWGREDEELKDGQKKDRLKEVGI